MSYKHSRCVWESDLKNGKLLVMLALAHFADDDGECYPKTETLAKMARVTDRQARRILNELEKSGHISILQRAVGRGKQPKYKLFPDEKADISTDTKADISDDAAEKSGHFSTGKADISDTPAQDEPEKRTFSSEKVDISDSAERKADISDNKSGHFYPVKVDISGDFQSCARSEHQLEHQEKTEKEQTHARDPLMVAWRQAYADIEMPPKLAASLKELAAECSIAAAIHGIKASADNPDGRNFKYIAECARNYVPPAKMTGKAEYGHTYAIDIPGVAQMQPPAEPSAPKLPPPMAHDDPWQIAVSELSGVLPGSAPHWLTGSYFEQNGELAGVPFYRIVMTQPGADAEWMMRQVEPAVRKKLGGILGKRIVVEFATVHAEMEPA